MRAKVIGFTLAINNPPTLHVEMPSGVVVDVEATEPVSLEVWNRVWNNSEEPVAVDITVSLVDPVTPGPTPTP